MVDVSQHVIPNSTEFCYLDCKVAFENLTNQEKLYSYFLSQACWYGGQIVLYQVSRVIRIICELFSFVLFTDWVWKKVVMSFV